MKKTRTLSICMFTLALLLGIAPVMGEASSETTMEEQYLAFQKQLKSEKPEDQAEAHLGIAKLYLSIMDKREALAHLDLAVVLSDGRKDIQTMRDELHEAIFPTPSTLQTIRDYNKAKRMFMDLSFGLESATNVTQESIEPTTPSNKEDTAFVLNGLVGYLPQAKIGEQWTQSLQFSFASYLYADQKDLNLLSLNFEHRLSGLIQTGGGPLSLDGYWGLGHVNSDHDSLLSSFNLGMDWKLFAKDLPFQPKGALSFTETSYHDSTYSAQEGSTIQIQIGGDAPIKSKIGDQLETLITYQLEDLESGASSFNQFGLQLRYPISIEGSILKNLTPYVELSERRYDEIDVGATLKRKDGKWKVGLEAFISQMDHHRWTVNLFSMENDSNDLIYHYRNTQLTILYGISL